MLTFISLDFVTLMDCNVWSSCIFVGVIYHRECKHYYSLATNERLVLQTQSDDVYFILLKQWWHVVSNIKIKSSQITQLRKKSGVNFQGPRNFLAFCHLTNKMAATTKNTTPPITEPTIIMKPFSNDISETDSDPWLRFCSSFCLAISFSVISWVESQVSSQTQVLDNLSKFSFR